MLWHAVDHQRPLIASYYSLEVAASCLMHARCVLFYCLAKEGRIIRRGVWDTINRLKLTISFYSSKIQLSFLYFWNLRFTIWVVSFVMVTYIVDLHSSLRQTVVFLTLNLLLDAIPGSDLYSIAACFWTFCPGSPFCVFW